MKPKNMCNFGFQKLSQFIKSIALKPLVSVELIKKVVYKKSHQSIAK